MADAGPYDVIVVGAGNAALCAALSAQEQGAKVLVLEKASEEERGGNSTFTAGGFRFVHNGVGGPAQATCWSICPMPRRSRCTSRRSRRRSTWTT